ncbi:DUF397 domain-containing protein [Streptomyces sp. PSKA30]|uniref:DUF397 domain-containing protein n=1 Tax=Streptomyces sp. PSKA30 TaxID=2874597 RepID=UPI001CD18D7F|nr:DUF397 domain-containing protein [Streptomyces sp. PSKA30]MBZ9638491.1 DUF397 domain-containing protein [Streptomyces sp. PSKA30]
MNVEQTGPVVVESAWLRSSYSTGSGGECVEVAACSGTVHIRDSKDRTRPVLSVSSGEWTAFIRFTAQN